MSKDKKRDTYTIINTCLVLAEGAAVITSLIFMSVAETTAGTVISAAMIPLSGLLLITPVLIRSALKDFKNWHVIHTSPRLPEDRAAGFYRIKDPEDLSRKLFWRVFWEQYKNAFAGLMLLIAAVIFNFIIFENSSVSRIQGRAFMVILIIFIVGMPYLVYLFFNTILRLRVLMKREYFVYHAVVSNVDFVDMTFCYKHRLYKYKYCACVGIRAKDVDNTPATLVFLPDEVYLIPDDAYRSYGTDGRYE